MNFVRNVEREQQKLLNFTGDTVPLCLRSAKHLKKMSWNMAESESLMGIPGLVYLRQAATRSDCRYYGYKCHSPRYILHARVVGLATLDYFTICRVEALLIS